MPLSANPKRARVPAWIPLGIALAGFLWLLTSLSRDAQGRGVASVDASCYRLHSGAQWVSEAWRNRIERVLVRAGRIPAGDREAIGELARDLAQLSFVAEVGEPEVIWPDGLSLPIRLREPVACVGVGEDFLPVAVDGTVLAGYSYAPHEAYGGWLPVLGPAGIVYETMNPLQPGDVLDDPRHVDALAVAASMNQYLGTTDRRALGRVLIDASRKLGPDSLPGGVRLDLEGARRILFGRPPGGDFPGELRERDKWENVSEGLARLAAGEAWEVFDVRWDVPDQARRDDSLGED
ncbi:MAG: hypothetical protein GY711_19540 [bacterium]|nr:hypothetical protein [bacterium]